ncbi:MAG: glycosyltransferase family 2 protein [Lachnospiraceae bacterium]|nr:glycosyltransferase family 2 protein [Lachnospiraceae bacterium]
MPLGVVISNHNMGYKTVECISSVFHSDIDAFQVFVVDMASTDSSVSIIDNRFGNRITLTCCTEDLGSCGGLNIGIRQALEAGCDYICCLGEAVTVEPSALKNMLHFIQSNQGVGMVGGKVYHRHLPHYIQQFGISIDFKNFRAVTLYADCADNDAIPGVVYCDAVSACAMLVSAAAIEKAGLMPEDNFLYWDDTEWGFRMKQAGFEVAALSDAKMYHSASPMRRCDNTKVNYYMTRNCLNFFMKYTRPEKCMKMSIVLLRSIFESFYLHRMGHAHNMAQSDLTALNDAIYGLRGMAPASRILENDESGLSFVSFFEEQERVYMEDDDPFLEQVIRQINPNIIFLQLPASNAVTIVRCKSILEIKDFDYNLDFSDDVVYIDKSYRMLATREDARLVKNYEAGLQLFLYAMQPQMLRRISEMRTLQF